jgi:epoxyqueuosine reductase
MNAAAVKSRALELGFDRCGIAPAADLPELPFLAQWIARGYAGSLRFLTRSAGRRADVRRVLPSARSVIVTATVYNTDRPYSVESADPWRAQIARYAWGQDYHEVVGARMAALLAWMRETSEVPFEGRAHVDTGPIQERVYARHAGLGWIGKNCCVINPELGSWMFLGAIICSLPLECDQPSLDQCGDCALCLEACPTQAFRGPGVLDATRCISFLTIEHRGDLPPDLAPKIGAHAYGCDVCQDVCPWNAAAAVSADPAWQPRPIWDEPPLRELQQRSDDELADGLLGSAMDRAGGSLLRRNVDQALANAAQSGAGSTALRRTP